MVITESQIRKIIQEEIEAMIEEGQIDEAFADSIRKGVGNLAGRFASKLGATSAGMADIEKADAEKKAAGEASAAAAKKEAAKTQVVQKVRDVSQKLLKLDNEIRQLQDLAAPLSYAGGGKLDVRSVGTAVEALMSALDKVEQDVTGERGHVKGAGLGIQASLKEKKVAAK
jgi:hypothetical protein